MATNLVVGTTSSPSATTAYPTPSKRIVYWGVSGLEYQVKEYTGFYLYLSNSFSFTNGQTSAPSGKKIATYSSTTSTATSFTQSLTVPSRNFKAGHNTGIVCVALSNGKYWRIGGNDNSPKKCYVNLNAKDWFYASFSINVSVTGSTTATANITHSGYNSPPYIKSINRCTSSTSTSGSNSQSGTEKQYVTLNRSNSSSQSVTMSITGLTAGSSNTLYFTAHANSDFATYRYYGLGSISITTDANYSGTTSASVTGSTTATISCTVNNTTNLDGNIYYSTTSGLTSKPTTYVSYDSNRKGTKSLTGLTANQPYKYYFYVYSSVSNKLYSIGSITFTTDASSYTMTASASNISSNSAVVSITSGPEPTTNLNSYWYLSTSTDSSLTSLENVSSALRTNAINLNNLDSQATITRNIYVYSSISEKYYKAGSISFETTIPQYDASLIVSGVTGTQADITLFNLNNTTNLDENYYLTKIKAGNVSSNIENPISNKRGLSIRIENLIPGYGYSYYCYVYNTYDNNYYYVNSINFNTYSTIVYYKDDNLLKKYRLYIYDTELQDFKGIILR